MKRVDTIFQAQCKIQTWGLSFKRKEKKVLLRVLKGFPGGSVVKNPPANEGDWGSCLAPGDPTCPGATKPLGHNYKACAQEPRSRNYWSLRPRAHALQQERPPQWEALTPQLESSFHSLKLEKSPSSNEHPSIKKTLFKKFYWSLKLYFFFRVSVLLTSHRPTGLHVQNTTF